MRANFIEIQNEVVRRYRIDLCDGTRCADGDHSRTHAHVKERRVCKWKQKNTIGSTFDLFHEIGHIENHEPGERRAESEYNATTWAIDRCREFGLEIPLRILYGYQEYIVSEVSRGIRRHGKDYPKMNLYEYAGVSIPTCSIANQLRQEWWCEEAALAVL